MPVYALTKIYMPPASCLHFLQCIAGKMHSTKKTTQGRRARRRFKGHGWSKKGSKSARKAARLAAEKPKFYAVPKGWRPGIYRQWKNARAQVEKYSGAVHKCFGTLKEARRFMRENMLFPPGVHEPFPPAPNTPLPPDEYIYGYSDSDDESLPPMVQIAPAHIDSVALAPVCQMAVDIDNEPSNQHVQPSLCDCGAACPYSGGPIMQQRFLLLQRLYQLNAMLS